jgi:hypothetical protein
VTRDLQENWPEYLIEAWALGTFTVSAALFTALLEYPGSPVHQLIPNGAARRALVGQWTSAVALGSCWPALRRNAMIPFNDSPPNTDQTLFV